MFLFSRCVMRPHVDPVFQTTVYLEIESAVNPRTFCAEEARRAEEKQFT